MQDRYIAEESQCWETSERRRTGLRGGGRDLGLSPHFVLPTNFVRGGVTGRLAEEEGGGKVGQIIGGRRERGRLT